MKLCWPRLGLLPITWLPLTRFLCSLAGQFEFRVWLHDLQKYVDLYRYCVYVDNPLHDSWDIHLYALYMKIIPLYGSWDSVGKLALLPFPFHCLSLFCIYFSPHTTPGRVYLSVVFQDFLASEVVCTMMLLPCLAVLNDAALPNNTPAAPSAINSALWIQKEEVNGSEGVMWQWVPWPICPMGWSITGSWLRWLRINIHPDIFNHRIQKSQAWGRTFIKWILILMWG